MLDLFIREFLKEQKEKCSLGDEKIQELLRSHYSDEIKLSRPNMEKMLGCKDEYDYLNPPKDLDYIYRGLMNMTLNFLKKHTNLNELSDEGIALVSFKSDPVKDKSWTTSLRSARKFAEGDWTIEKPEKDKYSVVLVANSTNELLLNWELTSKLSMAKWEHPKWNEPLKKSIVDEKEVLAYGSVEIKAILWKKN